MLLPWTTSFTVSPNLSSRKQRFLWSGPESKRSTSLNGSKIVQMVERGAPCEKLRGVRISKELRSNVALETIGETSKCANCYSGLFSPETTSCICLVSRAISS